MNQMISEKYLNFFLLMAFWKFQHFNLVSMLSQKLFKPLPCPKSIGKMLHAISIFAVAVHSGERVVARGPLIYICQISFPWGDKLYQ